MTSRLRYNLSFRVKSTKHSERLRNEFIYVICTYRVYLIESLLTYYPFINFMIIRALPVCYVILILTLLILLLAVNFNSHRTILHQGLVWFGPVNINLIK